MTQRPGTFFRDVGKMLHLPAALAALSLPVILYFEEWFALLPFGTMAVCSLILGQLLYQPFKKHETSSRGQSLKMVALCWLLFPVLSMIIFYGTALSASVVTYPAIAVFQDPVNCFFESMSGFTGTGLTMVDNPANLPYTLQWWRSLMEWVGGIGIIMLASFLLDFNQDQKQLYKAETRDWKPDSSSVTETIRKIWMIYVAYSIISVVAFYAGGMPFWEALNHGLTGISTGGFAVTEDSFISYSVQIKVIAIVVMLIGAFSFKIHYLLLLKVDLKRLFRQTQLRYFLVFLVGAVVAIMLIYPAPASIDLLFQVASALGTCGFNSVELSRWPMQPIFLLSLLMLLGGNSSSTTGGIKTNRMAWLTKAVWRGIKKVWLSEEDKTIITYNGEALKREEANKNIIQAARIYFLWMITLAFGALALSLFTADRFTFEQILFDTASALGNVGLSAGVAQVDLPAGAKLLLTLLMWLGRLEILAVLFLLLTPFHLLISKKSIQVSPPSETDS